MWLIFDSTGPTCETLWDGSPLSVDTASSWLEVFLSRQGTTYVQAGREGEFSMQNLKNWIYFTIFKPGF